MPRHEGTVMRRLAIVLATIGLAADASAGDFDIPDLPVLRGSSPFIPAPPTFTRWSGAYAGVQAGYGNGRFDFSGATKSLIAYELRELALESQQHPSSWKFLGTANDTNQSVGIFAGYNSQFDDAVLGVDVHYNRTDFIAIAPSSPIARLTSAGGNTYAVTLDGAATMRITDWGVARVRGGYVIDTVMPYVTAGVAFGRADISRSVTISIIENPFSPFDPTQCPSAANPSCGQFVFTNSETKKGSFIFGWALGGGADVMLMPHVFLRGEYEYVAFSGLAGIKTSMHTARLGGGFKF
ncbi:MAG: outer rane immunogenic protein [Alphaproteobacteria bacterium]|nr:outer rane immunogenic protein [Alphaproteobacteria bacterium]